jgi:cyanate permease
VEFSKMFGVGQILTGLMGGLGPWVTGQISDHTGSYTIPIYLVTGLLGLSVVIALAARPRGLRKPAAQPEAPAVPTLAPEQN